MNHFITRKFAAQTLLAALMGLAGSSSMAATSWALDSCTTQLSTGSSVVVGGVTATNIGNSYQCAAASGANKVTVTAYGSATAGSTTYGAASVIQNGVDYGFGVGTAPEGGSSATPAQHTIDNDPTTGASDLILLKFDTAVALGSVTIGWTTNDSDFTIMAYTGSGTPTISGSTASAIGATAGWSLIQHVGDGTGDVAYGDTGTNSTKDVNAANVTASWWLISAYNASFGGTAITGADTLKDYIKVMTVASKDIPTGKTPEPASLALVGLALAGAAGIRRRSTKSN